MVLALSCLFFMSSLSTLRFCFCGPAFSITYDYSIVVSRVRKLLQQRDYIRVAHGLYSQSNYPTCVRSHYHAVTLTGFIHSLSYIPREKPVLKHRERIYRKALLKVKSRKPPLLVVKAYKDTLDTSIIKKNDYANIDHAVSGRYDIYFAQDNCFVAATTLEGWEEMGGQTQWLVAWNEAVEFLSVNCVYKGPQFMLSGKASVAGGVWKAHRMKRVQALACDVDIPDGSWLLDNESIEGHIVDTFQ
nr:uncharacterized protein LOC119179130 [Rhipicephalus microplus]